MADEKAKRDFSDILKHLNSKFDITDCKWKEHKLFEIKFRIQIRVDSDDYNLYCDEWVNKFSHVTNTVWVNKISNTGPKVKFRKQYQCWPYREKEVKNELLFDARKCRGTLDVKILGESSYTKKKNKHMRLGLNGLVKINFQHLHLVDTNKDCSFFVHYCEPLPDVPRPIHQSNEKLPELVAKMVEKAAITSQKAAEKVEEVLKKQRIRTGQNLGESNAAVQMHQAISYDQIPQEINVTQSKYDGIAQVIVNVPPDPISDKVFYLQHVTFDSATQSIIEEMIPVSEASFPNMSGQHLIQMQLPQLPNPQACISNQIVNQF
ncbi:uncharacterized protein LOC143198673 [Rhynchophorus ferrugineus]|uniref:uncharacterized protein LOC143198673 n=1 Tax=Rhynchophorus ferrugineus TaxID=354439 RepID=UPI003FCD6AB6